ncbi:deoxyribose-phosphate aldolase [Candidatus Stoquefichus massiliensis]|uniref:deoxyribose-phosphate aldolase n=1 Tax=Candidatus Stoquefichus massiliensis TaxID=1470350 RepID=UPI00048610AF|nr:deoxyribose-phosphate aldolase [Candidatus Stoquefichus massiliensis]
MEKDILASYIDHAVLDPQFTVEQLEEKIMIGVNYGCKSVCVNPSAIDIAKECIYGSKTLLCVVCDFPFGSSTTESKVLQAQSIIKKGDVFEIDMVMNYGLLKSQQYDAVIHEITMISVLCHQHHVGLKVIVETDALTKEEIKAAVECCIQGEADYIKTSTGYFKSEHLEGASPDVIRLIVETAQGRIKVKGSGCVRTRERLIELIELGIDRAGVGCSSTAKILGISHD